MGQYQTFIVRFWSDPAATDELRGHIQHIASGRGVYFRDVERMVRFMDEHRGSPMASDLRPSNGTPPGSRLPVDRELPAKTEDVSVYES